MQDPKLCESSEIESQALVSNQCDADVRPTWECILPDHPLQAHSAARLTRRTHSGL